MIQPVSLSGQILQLLDAESPYIYRNSESSSMICDFSLVPLSI